MASADHGVYVYGVASAADAGVLPRGNGGVDPAGQLDLVLEGNLVAVCSDVDTKLLTPERETHDEELAWLERMARAHDEVLARALAAEAIVPFRLGVVMPDRGRLRQVLRGHADAFESHLARLRGTHEWGLKGFVDPGLVPDPAGSPAPIERHPAAAGGAAFFARKQREQRREEHVRGWAAALAGELHDRAAAVAREAIVNPPRAREAAAYADEMILNGAYLVERSRAQQLADTVHELTARHAAGGVRLELTGPWPPYSFVDSTIAATA